MEPAGNLLDFAIFVSYFPPRVAGPIERASHLLPRILAPRRVTRDHWCRGMFLVAQGMMKKVALADGLAPSEASIYNTAGVVTGVDVAAATLAFAVQINCDFSGYSDIACGCSLFFGIDLLKNFDQPYFSVNPSEFWRRWHISLSSWLRDYLYIPHGGNKTTVGKTYRNLMLTMLLGGLWPGATWTFVLWSLGVWQFSAGYPLYYRRAPAPVRGLIYAAFFFITVLGTSNDPQQFIYFQYRTNARARRYAGH